MTCTARTSASELSVLMIGAGGLGAPALLQLAASGVKKVGIVDSDRVELSNLHRQILYREADVGRPKALVARERLRARFPQLQIEDYVSRFRESTSDMLEEYDLVLDGTDQFETKLLISDLCTDARRPYVFAGVVGTDGQVMAVRPHVSACLRCLFEEAPPPGATPTCREQGVIGPIAGLVAAEQVRRGLALAVGDESVTNALWSYDGRRAKERVIRLARTHDCRGCGDQTHLRGWLSTASTAAEEEILSQSDADVLSLTNEVCPQTYICTKKALDALAPGDKLWVHIGSDESARNVPASVVAAGYRLLAQKFDGETHRLLFDKPKEG
jgi:molybdopterin-synthase adenylyltransferase